MSVVTDKVAREYLKNKELKKEDIVVLQKWVTGQPHLPKISEYYLILFLHSCYYDIEAAKTTIDNFYTMKTQWPTFLQNRDPNSESLRKSMKNSAFAKLPQKTPEGFQLFFLELIHNDIANYIFANELKLMDMKIRLWLEEEGTSPGVIFIMSMKGVDLPHILKMGFFETKHYMTYVQEALPVRLKGLYFVNSGAAIEKLTMFIKPFMKKKLFGSLHVYKDIPEEFYKVFPQECLPKDYGGKADSLINYQNAITKQLLDAADFFIEDDKQVIDDSKRIRDVNQKSWYSGFF